MELNQETKNLIKGYQIWQRSLRPKEGVSTIHVDEVAMKVAAFYEQIRTIIDWKEEHLMRRAAIIRKLKRRFLDLELNNFSEKENVAESLIMELIRGGHFPNDRIEETKIISVQKIVEKYIFILKNNPENKEERAGLQFYNWLLEVAACEIEETLAPSIKEMALINFMFEMIKNRIKVSEKIYELGLLKKEDTDVQIYIAVQQALFKMDDPIISYNLIKYKYPKWEEESEDELFKVSQNIYQIFQGIENDLNHPLARKFYTICEKYDTPYLLLGDVLSHPDIEKIGREIQDPHILEQLVRKSYIERLIDLKKRINRAAIYSTISIFATKILSLIVLELILARIFEGHVSVIILIADVLIPTALMFLLVMNIRPPSEKNLHVAVMETIKIVYQKEKNDIYEVRMNRKRGPVTRTILSLIYLLGACISFGFIYWVLGVLKFPDTSIVINIIFIALILFAGTALNRRAQELTIAEESEGFVMFIADILFLPITGLGRWMSSKWKKYNAIAAFFNALIDMPFSAFVEFLERWRYFIKERKEEIR